MTLGFSSAFRQPFETVWANDFNSYAVRTYNLNFGDHCIVGDICELLETSEIKIPSADVVIGGPPCQGFSLLNKKRRGDRRRKLWLPYLEVVERSGAQVFVMENVPQLLDSPEYAEIEEAARDLGFNMKACKLVAADYGVPQTRTRAFVLASRIADPGDFFPPPRSHYNCKNGHVLGFDEFASESKPWRTVRDAIGDLPPPVGTSLRTGEDPPANLHFGRSPTQKSVERYRAIPEPGMNRVDLQQRRLDLTPRCWINKKGGTDLFGRLWWDRPAFTIRTEFFKPEKGRYLHPEQHRPITHREAARFQSFPDDFAFAGTKIEIAKQIGNAVPPRLAAAVAQSVVAMLAGASRRRIA